MSILESLTLPPASIKTALKIVTTRSPGHFLCLDPPEISISIRGLVFFLELHKSKEFILAFDEFLLA